MTRATIYARTDKGARTAASASRELANDLRKVLDAIDGTSSVDVLQSKLNFRSADWLDRALAALVEKELIREAESATGLGLLDFTSVQSSPQTEEHERKAQDIRAKIQARREAPGRSPPDAEAQARKLAEEQALREAAERTRQDAEVQTRKLAEEQVLKEAAERARHEAEAQARKLAEEQALREAAERTRQDAEAQARKLAEAQELKLAAERVRRKAAEHARQEAEAQARKLAEEQALREAVEHARQEAEAQARKATEEQTRREAEEKARREAEEQARRDAEEEARREAAEHARQEAAAQARKAVEEQTRREAEEKARRKAEEQARRDAEEEARREAAEHARQEAAAQARKAAEEHARREAAEEARRKTEEQARREAAEQARHESEEQARVAAEEQARREAEKKLRREQEAAASTLAKAKAAAKEGKAGLTRSRKWGKPLALGIAALILAGLVIIHLISFDGRIPQFEKSLAGQFQQPVKIQALRLSLLPQPHLRLEGVSIGSEGQIKIPQLQATGELGNLFSDKKVFKSVELDSPVVTEAGLGWILFGKPLARDVVFGEVRASNARLESKNLNLPAFDARLQSDDDGIWKSIVIESVDKNLNLGLTPKGELVQIDFKARSFRIPFGSDLTLDDLVASGTADRAELAVTEFKGFAYGGILGGKARLKWGANWSLSGELNAKQIDTSRLLPGLMGDGRLVGTAAYAMQAPDAAKLFAANRLEGDFTVSRGILLGVDLGRMLQGGPMRGDTRFAEATANFVHDHGATQLRQVRLSEGAMSASGTADVDANDNVRGRFAIELKRAAERQRANLAVSGTLKKVEWLRP